jgi:rSAM/selenodomain-associated transferase 2
VQLSVIIPALNEAANIAQAVASAWAAGAYEVLVADGGSTDDTAALAEANRARVIRSLSGRALQQNAAAREAIGDVLLFLHADCGLPATAARQVESALANLRVLHGAFRQRIAASGLSYRLLEAGNAARVRCLGMPYGDQATFVRRTVFEELGGFPAVPLMEDLILMQRLRRKAWPVLLAGPLAVSPRRWQRHGIIRQTLRNWRLTAAYSLGASPERLARQYQRHDAAHPDACDET